MGQDIIFKLQPTDSEIPGLIGRYEAKEDDDFLAAGARILKGDFSKENLLIIYQWKLQAYKRFDHKGNYFDKNSDEDVSRILQSTIKAAVEAQTPERALHELQLLKGIGPPVASAILTAIFPDRFTVIDVMALRALGVTEVTKAEALYPKYVAFCGSQAERLGISLRDMDRALWQWGHEHPPKKKKG